MQQPIPKRGFSLIEISLAIFVVATGMLTLFSLFPAGLKQVAAAHESTQEALFGDYVLSTLRAKAMRITNVTEWVDINTFQALTVQLPSGALVQQGNAPVEVPYPDVASDRWIRYILQFNDAGNNLRSATLWCRSGQYGTSNVDDFKKSGSSFYTEFFYSGMP